MKFKSEIKVGLFAAVVILILVYATYRVGDQTAISGGGYQLEGVFSNVSGLRTKSPVELAGVDVGVVKKVKPYRNKALVTFAIDDDVILSTGSKAFLRTRGFLGDAYLEVVPGDPDLPLLKDGDRIENTFVGGDINDMMNRFNDIADDVKTMSGQARETTMPNLDQLVSTLKEVALRNEKNFDRIAENLAVLSERLRQIVEEGGEDANQAMGRINSIAQKIDEGRGTLGKLVNDEETVEKLNTAVESLNEALGSFNKWQFDMGYHTEYLSQTEDFKHYVSMGVRPAPDKAFLFDIVEDPTPDTKRKQVVSQITTGGTTSTVTTETSTLTRDETQFSAQIAKKYYDLTLRGGIIESKGGLGLDYDVGPMSFSFSAFDFENDFNEKPHLKMFGTLNLTENFFFMGGADDPLNPAQKTDYFMGAGFRLVDEDIKSVLKLGSLLPGK